MAFEPLMQDEQSKDAQKCNVCGRKRRVLLRHTGTEWFLCLHCVRDGGETSVFLVEGLRGMIEDAPTTS